MWSVHIDGIPLHTPPVHWSCAVQTSPSLQAVPSALAPPAHVPPSHCPLVQLSPHAVPSVTGTPAHWPPMHVSPLVQLCPSLHDSPSETGMPTQDPDAQ